MFDDLCDMPMTVEEAGWWADRLELSAERERELWREARVRVAAEGLRAADRARWEARMVDEVGYVPDHSMCHHAATRTVEVDGRRSFVCCGCGGPI